MVSDSLQTVQVDIVADSVFGVRHGVETLLQLIPLLDSGDDISYVTFKGLSIEDKPRYKHRGYDKHFGFVIKLLL